MKLFVIIFILSISLAIIDRTQSLNVQYQTKVKFNTETSTLIKARVKSENNLESTEKSTAQTNAKAKSEAKIKSETNTKSLLKLKTIATSQTASTLKSKSESKVGLQSKTDALAKSESKLKTNVQTVAKVETIHQSQVLSKLETNSNFLMKNAVKVKLDSDLKLNEEKGKTGKKVESIMEYLNVMEEQETKNKTKIIQRNIRLFNDTDTNSTNTTKHKILSFENPDIILEEEKHLELIKEGWLKVSSSQLLNTNKYPKITFPDNTEHQIPTERDYFRVNEGYDPLRNPDSPPSPFYFWMRLSKRNFYYSLSKPSINVVGNIPVKDITDAYVLKEFARSNTCFKVDDYSVREWTLCAQTKHIRNEWVCTIRALKQLEDFNTCMKRLEADDAVVIQKKVTQPIILIPQASPMCNEKYNYENHGHDWECDCREGREQSPVELPLPEQAIKSPVKPIFDYNEVSAKQNINSLDGSLRGTENLKIELVNHVLRIKHDNFGKIVTMDGSLYTAQEILFHTPAEHTIDGKRYDMEMQIIHYGQTVGDIAKQVIFSFLFEAKPGYYNKFIDDIDFFNLPNPINKSKDLENNLFIPKIFYNSRDDDPPIMKPFSFYTYQGSLTSPPCTERTIVYVAAEPIKLGTTAIQLFEESLRMPDLEAIPSGDIIMSTRNVWNNRDLQNKNGRNIFYYDAKSEMCVEPPKAVKQRKGHYERIDADVTKYYYVSGPKPSGIPGAFVVSKAEAVGKGLLPAYD